MGYKEELLNAIERVQDLLDGEDRAVKALERRCDKLEEQNDRLFDKLMSRDWESWIQTKQMLENAEHEERYQPLSPEQDEENAGMALALEIKEDDTSE